MIPKSGGRFSEKTMLHQTAGPRGTIERSAIMAQASLFETGRSEIAAS